MEKQNEKEGKLSQLPVAAAEFIRLVVNKMRYRKQVREDVQAELAAHFEDELKGCKADAEREQKAKQLVGGFGDVKMLAVLLRRAKKRCRPLWRTVVARAFQTVGVLFICLVLYVVWFLTGKPVVTRDYIAEFNNLVRPVADESLNAAPLYNKAIEVFEELPDNVSDGLGKKYYEATEEDKQLIGKWLTDNDEVFELVVAGTRKGNKDVAVVDGKEDRAYDTIAGLVLSPNGDHWAYAAQRGKNWFVVVDGQESEEKYDGIYEDCIVFSPDGKRLSYAAIKNDKGFVVVDGKKGKLYDTIDNSSIVFSSDSKRFAYRAIRDKKQFYVIDAKEGKAYDGVGGGTLIFSSDNNRVAYMALENNEEFVVLDGQEDKKYGGISPPVFNPVNNTLAYSAKQNEKWFVVNDGKEVGKYNITGIPVFSPDGKHIAYRANRTEKQIVVRDAKEGKDYDEISQSSLMFTPDNEHIIYHAREDGKSIVVVNGLESKSYDIIFQIGEFTFSGFNSFNFVALLDDEFLAVDIQIVEN